MELNQTAKPFQYKIADLADKYEKPADLIYHWWKEYCITCRNYDQSPVLFEFENWYKAQLEGAESRAENGNENINLL